ncbi:MAG: hypothetical protein CM1200mP9_05470 [Gammaproteobacteria bacterium]|nr:MAG: hypothetical protein CM1200mP9_05470 [Gammaproteobacteria bacterium]
MPDNVVRATSSVGWLLLIVGIVIGVGIAIFQGRSRLTCLYP